MWNFKKYSSELNIKSIHQVIANFLPMFYLKNNYIDKYDLLSGIIVYTAVKTPACPNGDRKLYDIKYPFYGRLVRY